MADGDSSTTVEDRGLLGTLWTILGSWIARFGKEFWTFFFAALLLDFGFGLFFFLFNLYLVDLHFNERIIGQTSAALTFGNVVGTIPATFLSRRYGLRRMLLFTFIAAPVLCAIRLAAADAPSQIGLAFLTGICMCCWPICFSPVVARATTESNRTAAFSIVFATGIGSGVLVGLAGGYLPGLFLTGAQGVPIVGIRIVLLLSCGIFLLGSWPIWKLANDRPEPSVKRRIQLFHPFLLRFLPPFVAWNVVTGSFPIFGSVYLQQSLGMPLNLVGTVFSASQFLQFATVLATPLLFRRVGTVSGIALAQLCTALALILLANTTNVPQAVTYYLFFNCAQWMCGPGIYRLLMDSVPEEERSTASAIQNLSGAICQAATAAVTGSCIVGFGYRPVFFGNAGFAVVAALAFLILTGSFFVGKTNRTEDIEGTRLLT